MQMVGLQKAEQPRMGRNSRGALAGISIATCAASLLPIGVLVVDRLYIAVEHAKRVRGGTTNPCARYSKARKSSQAMTTWIKARCQQACPLFRTLPRLLLWADTVSVSVKYDTFIDTRFCGRQIKN